MEELRRYWGEDRGNNTEQHTTGEWGCNTDRGRRQSVVGNIGYIIKPPSPSMEVGFGGLCGLREELLPNYLVFCPQNTLVRFHLLSCIRWLLKGAGAPTESRAR